MNYITVGKWIKELEEMKNPETRIRLITMNDMQNLIDGINNFIDLGYIKSGSKFFVSFVKDDGTINFEEEKA